MSLENILTEPNPAGGRSRPNSLEKPRGLVVEEWDMNWPRYAPLGASVRGDVEGIKNTFTTPLASDFMVRDIGYLNGTKKAKDATKTGSEDSAYSIVGVNVFKSKKSLDHIATKVDELKQYLKANATNKIGDDGLPQFLIVTWMFKSFWSREYTCVVHLFHKTIDLEVERKSNQGEQTGFERAFEKFMQGDDNLRSNKFKFAFTIHEGPNSFKKTVNAMGGQKPVLIGKALKTTFHQGDNYLEIDIDVGSSKIASMLNSVILKASAGIVVSTMWSLEATEEQELPERVLGAVKWHYIDVKDVYIQLDENYNVVN